MNCSDDKRDFLRTFNRVYAKYYNRCVLYAKSYLWDHAQAEDLASEALIKLWTELDKGHTIDNPGAFLMTVLKNMLADHFRHEQMKSRAHQQIQSRQMTELDIHIHSLENTNPNEMFVSDVEKIIDATMSQIPEQSRRIFFLSRAEQKPNKEIADMLHITEKGVEYHISKVLKVLRRNLKDYLPVFLLILINF